MHRSRAALVFCVFLVLNGPEMLAQVGYPGGGYPGGGYPGGGYPGGGGGVGLPFPRRGKNKKTAKDKQKEDNEPLNEVTGMLRSMNDKNVVVEAQDTRIINLKRTDRTKFLKNGEEIKASEIKAGDKVTVEARQDEEGFFTAVNVIWQREGTAGERIRASQEVQISTQASRNGDDDERPILRRAGAATPDERSAAGQAPSEKEEATEVEKNPPAVASAASPVEPATASEPAPLRPDPPVTIRDSAQPIPDIEEDGVPRLRRGKPVLVKKPAPARREEPVQTASAKLPPGRELTRESAPAQAAESAAEPAVETVTAHPDDIRIEKAREAALSFTESLPNYVAQQFTARFVSQSHITNWQAQDVISAEVVYESGRESYRNLAINGKPTKKTMEELPGSWSTGEFGILLVDLFSRSTAADFRYRKESRTSGRDALLYDYTVEQENSHWRVQVASQTVLPAYRGSVWIDKETNRVLRIEMQARNVPSEFPLDKIETALDYEFVRLADRQYLVPVHSETLSCQRGTNVCSRNAIDFRNYHKFSGESNIQFQK